MQTGSDSELSAAPDSARQLRQLQARVAELETQLAQLTSRPASASPPSPPAPEPDLGTLELAQLIDVPALQALMDDFHALAPVPMAVIDLHGRVLVGVGWQDVCTKFHRVQPEACKHCVESDTVLSAGVAPGEFRLYRCKNNMWDIATPIRVGGQHLGNVFMGQFFFDDEEIDTAIFREQARRYGFDEARYLAALDAVPRLSREDVRTAMAFFLKLADMLSRSGYANAKLARAAAEREALLGSLRESQERLSRAQEIAHLGSWELDCVEDRLVWSDEVYRIFGLEPQEFAATYEAFLERVHPEDRAAVDAAYLGSLREGRDAYEIEHRIVRSGSGEVRWVHEKCAHLRDGSGRIVRSVGMVLDITGRKRAELELRTAKEDLEEADRRKNEFLATLSHELRNPLAPVLNSLHILERTAPGSEPAQRAQQVIQRQVGQLARLVDDLLDVTRISRNKIHLRREPLDLNDLARRTTDDYRSLFERSGVRLELRPAPEPLRVNGDWNRLAQVLGNLLQNAAKFTPRGGTTTVSLLAAPGAGQAVVRVADTGVGIAPEVLGRLFQPFTQAETTLERSQGGLGLGLALVKGLIGLHGGEIGATSPGPGWGARFEFRLPLERAEAEGRAPAGAAPPAATRRVLIIEDNLDAAESLREVLALNGHEVELAHSGPEGLERARAFAPEVVLCDIGLPGLDGYAVARGLREDPQLRSVFAVALSGYALEEDVAQSRAAGFDLHLAKPPDLDRLERILASGPGRHG